MSRRAAIRLRVFVSGATSVRLKAARGRSVKLVKRGTRTTGSYTLNLGRLRPGTYRLTLTAVKGKHVFVDRCVLRVR